MQKAPSYRHGSGRMGQLAGTETLSLWGAKRILATSGPRTRRCKDEKCETVLRAQDDSQNVQLRDQSPLRLTKQSRQFARGFPWRLDERDALEIT